MHGFESDDLGYQYENVERPFKSGSGLHNFGYSCKNPWCQGYNNYPYCNSPFYMGGLGYGMAWPWLLYNLKMMGPREFARLLEELEFKNK